MKRLVFDMFNEEYKCYENLGQKEFSDAIEDKTLHQIGKKQAKELSELIGMKVIYRIEKKSESGEWKVQVYLSNDRKGGN